VTRNAALPELAIMCGATGSLVPPLRHGTTVG
jgi:hypothetical protein